MRAGQRRPQARPPLPGGRRFASSSIEDAGRSCEPSLRLRHARRRLQTASPLILLGPESTAPAWKQELEAFATDCITCSSERGRRPSRLRPMTTRAMPCSQYREILTRWVRMNRHEKPSQDDDVRLVKNSKKYTSSFGLCEMTRESRRALSTRYISKARQAQYMSRTGIIISSAC